MLLLLPHGATQAVDGRRSTRRFDGADGLRGAAGARARDRRAPARPPTSRPCRRTTSPRSPLARRLSDLGAFRADVSGAGPTVYGLFADRDAAEGAAAAIEDLGETWLAAPAW